MSRNYITHSPNRKRRPSYQNELEVTLRPPHQSSKLSTKVLQTSVALVCCTISFYRCTVSFSGSFFSSQLQNTPRKLVNSHLFEQCWRRSSAALNSEYARHEQSMFKFMFRLDSWLLLSRDIKATGLVKLNKLSIRGYQIHTPSPVPILTASTDLKSAQWMKFAKSGWWIFGPRAS